MLTTTYDITRSISQTYSFKAKEEKEREGRVGVGSVRHYI
jgi:hypothetical protein